MDPKEFWNERAEHFQRIMEAGREYEYQQKLVRFLEERGAIRPGARILDVGCGAGKYAREFLKRGCHVTAMDVSDRMLHFARKNMAETGVPEERRVALERDWAEMDIEEEGMTGRYDLAFAANSPPVRDIDSIRKLCAASRGSCFVSKFTKRIGTMKPAFYEAMGLRPAPPDDYAERSRAIVEIVRDLGYEPIVRHRDYGWVNDFTGEEAAKHFTEEHRQHHEATADWIERVKKTAERLADAEGKVADRVEASVVWVWWEV